MNKNLKDLYIDYFIGKNHKKLESESIIPKNDNTVLFNTAGMQPLVPYLMGKTHPLGKRLTNYQKCFRLTDLDSVGDATHHTFFEMLGNWSLGDYFKEESITMSFEFLTKILNIPIDKLAVTVFKGNDLISADTQSANIWMSLGISKERIAYLDVEDNWWGQEAGGPCGPDTEIFYFRDDSVTPESFDPNDSRWVEIWNNVFMQCDKLSDGSIVPLKQQNVDTGMGYERVSSILEGVNDNYKSSVWKDVIKLIEEISNKSYEGNEKSMRIIADHIRAIVIIASDEAGIVPSNTFQGYILRRLIRRMIRFALKLDIDINSDFDKKLALLIVDKYKEYYKEVFKNKEKVLEVLINEKTKFNLTLEKGIKEFNKISEILKKQNINIVNGKTAFRLYDTFGFPIELTKDLANELDMEVDVDGFDECFKKHQEISRSGANVKFSGGMSDKSDEINIKYHTVTHLLHQALKDVLGNSVNQKGSNITPERLRFDFSFNRKVSVEEIEIIENIVNEKIREGLEVFCEEMSLDEAQKSGATCLFESKYDDNVKVYSIGNYSKEICGGPHVENTSLLGNFKIIKEEASSAGVRRIKAILN